MRRMLVALAVAGAAVTVVPVVAQAQPSPYSKGGVTVVSVQPSAASWR
jgi:hypothetical protein